MHDAPPTGPPVIAKPRLTVPVNPLTLATVIVEDCAGVPTGIDREVGFAVTVKSWTVNVTVAE